MHKDDEQKKDRHLLQAVLENAEAIGDLALSDGVLKAIPFVGTTFALIKGARDYRDRVLHAKLAAFLAEERLQQALGREEMLARLHDEGQADAIGCQLFLTLEKVTNFDKPKLLAKVFAAFLEGMIDRMTLLHLAHVIDATYAGDLNDFIVYRGGARNLELNARLASVGLISPLVNGGLGGGDLLYGLSGLGMEFLDALMIKFR